MNPPRQPAAGEPRRRNWARRAWSAYVGVLLGAGAMAALFTLGIVPVVIGLPFVGLTAGVTAFTFLGDDRDAFLRGQVIGFKLAVCGLAALGLFLIIGLWAYPLVGAAVVTSPALLRLVGRLRRKRSPAEERPGQTPSAERAPAGCQPLDRLPTLDMSDFEVMLVDADDELGTRTAPSTTVPPRTREPSPLEDLSLEDLCRVWRRGYVLLQQDLPPDAALEVLAAREQCLTEFELRCPDGVRAWLRSPAGATSDPRSYLLGSENT